MPDAIAATIKFIQRNYIFGIVIPNLFQYTELTFHRLLTCQKICHLHLEFFFSAHSDEVDFLVTILTDSHCITAAQHFQTDDIFEYLVDVLLIPSIHRLSDSMIHHV